MKKDDEIIQSLIAGGIIGAMLGSLISKDSDEGAGIGAIAGAAILATLKANENAQKTNVPVYIKENGTLYEVNSKGEKKFIKTINKSSTRVLADFKLK